MIATGALQREPSGRSPHDLVRHYDTQPTSRRHQRIQPSAETFGEPQHHISRRRALQSKIAESGGRPSLSRAVLSSGDLEYDGIVVALNPRHLSSSTSKALPHELRVDGFASLRRCHVAIVGSDAGGTHTDQTLARSRATGGFRYRCRSTAPTACTSRRSPTCSGTPR
jgi:hypothetical protein